MPRIVIGALIALAAAAPAASASAPAESPLGMNVQRVMNDVFDTDRWDFHLSRVEEDGIRLARVDAFWSHVEPNPPQNGVHTYDWGMLDHYAWSLARANQRWLPVLDYSARWASSDANDEHAPPTDNADFAAYASAFAGRYGRAGSFWDDYPELPELPVTTYEVWNEPNLGWFWRPQPDPARYADLYIRARDAIRAVDPHATVVVAGLAPGDPDEFVRAMYAARPELRGNVDGMGLHPYARTPAGVYAQVRSMRATLESLGDGAVPLHLTELGWVTSGDYSALVVAEDQRAARLEEVADALVRSDCNVATLTPHTWMTPEANPSDPEDWYGLVRPDGTRTASSEAYRRVVERWTTDPPDPANPVRICGPPPAPEPEPIAQPEAAPPLPAPLPEPEPDPDADGDGLLDAVEPALRTSPLDRDSDDDGLLDGSERRTSPARADSDRDGLSDGLERGVTAGVPDPAGPVAGTDPRRFRPDTHPRTRTLATERDTDRDGLRDAREDRDRDGFRDRRETDAAKRDTDRDGTTDRRDRSPLTARRS